MSQAANHVMHYEIKKRCKNIDKHKSERERFFSNVSPIHIAFASNLMEKLRRQLIYKKHMQASIHEDDNAQKKQKRLHYT